MTQMYSALIYPQVPQDTSYTRPLTPSTFTELYAVSESWDPYSLDSADRTEYWEDSAGTLTLDEVQLAILGLTGVQDAQIKELTQYYQTLISQTVQYTTAAGTTASFQTDPISRQEMLYTLAGCQSTGATPENFFWVAADNSRITPFTLLDLQNLSAAIFVMASQAFTHLQDRKAQVRNATTVLEVQSIVW